MKTLGTWCWPLGLLLGLSLLGQALPEAVLALFSRPAGTLAAWMLSKSYAFDAARGLSIAHPAGEVLVNGACSGFGFFTVLLALALSRPGWSPRRLPLLVAGAYGVTLLVNACRVVLAVHAQVFTLHFAHPDLLHAVHLAVGVAVFLPALMFLFFALERSPSHVFHNP